jgi:hypothetical protein
VLHAPPISFFSILSPEKYLVTCIIIFQFLNTLTSRITSNLYIKVLKVHHTTSQNNTTFDK